MVRVKVLTKFCELKTSHDLIIFNIFFFWINEQNHLSEKKVKCRSIYDKKYNKKPRFNETNYIFKHDK